MEKSNGHLALRAALAMGVPAVLALWAATRPEENSPQRVAGPEDLRLELQGVQLTSLADGSGTPRVVDAGEFLYDGSG